MHNPVLIAGLLTVLAGSALAAPSHEELKAVEQNLEATKKKAKDLDKQQSSIRDEVKKLQAQIVSLADKVRKNEEGLSKLEQELSELTKREEEKNLRLQHREAELAKTVGAMIKLGRTPAELAAVMPGSPSDGATAGRVLSSMVGSLKKEAESLKLDIMEIRNLGTQIAEKQTALATERDTFAENKSQLDTKLAERTGLEKSLQSDIEKTTREMAELSKKSETLKELITKLEENRREDQPIASLSNRPQPSVAELTKGKFRLPASGKVVSRFGDPIDANNTSKGFRIQTRDNAQVIAPASGEVVFTGPFLGYGRILILRHNDSYHSLVAGMKKINCVPGQSVVEGEPIGVMGAEEDNLTNLYLELRKNNKPVDPANWLPGKNSSMGG